MSIKIEITAGSIPEMAGKLVALAASFSGGTALATGTVAVGEPAPKATRARKPAESAPTAETPASSEAETPASASPAATEPAKDEPKADAPAALDFDNDVAPVVIRAVTTKGKPFVEEVLGTFGVAKASQLDEARWPELLTTLNDAMAA